MSKIQPSTGTAAAGLPLKPRKKEKTWKEWLIALPYLAPSIIIFVTFIFYPMFKSIYLSLFLTDMDGLPAVFVGFENYIDLIKSPAFHKSLLVTLMFTLYTVPTAIIIALALAVLANNQLRGISAFRVIYSSTISVSVATASVIWLLLFHPSMGILNYFLSFLGISSVEWLTDPSMALISISIMTIWMNIGFNFIVLISGLQNIPNDLYESAKIDGANAWNRFRNITLPLLSPTLFFVSIVSLINAFQAFGQIEILTKGGPSGSTTLLVYSIYREAFFNFQFGPASAQAVILFLIVLAFTFLQFRVGERKVFYQ